MQNIKLIIPVVLLLMFCNCKTNRFNSKGERTGKWFMYWDDTHVLAKGHYRKGLERGKWNYYFINGEKSRTEHYHKSGKIDIAYFYNNGKIESKGQAMFLPKNDSLLHYYWYGDWQFFDSLGTPKKTKHYEMGLVVPN